MLFEGHVENGQVVFDEPTSLPDGAKVLVELVPKKHEHEIPTLYERLKPIVGIAKGLPEDAALNHDYYLYGAPKKT